MYAFIIVDGAVIVACEKREVIKSVIGFLKLAIAILDKQSLQPFVSDIIQGLHVWVGDSKHRFKAKTRTIMIKLCRKNGYEHIHVIMLEKDKALITHIRKSTEREEKKKKGRQSTSV